MSVFAACGFGSCDSGALERGLSNCGAQAQLLHSLWDFPRPGIEPVVPALASGFLSIMPSGKPSFQKFRLDFSFLPYVWRSARSTSIGKSFCLKIMQFIGVTDTVSVVFILTLEALSLA